MKFLTLSRAPLGEVDQSFPNNANMRGSIKTCCTLLQQFLTFTFLRTEGQKGTPAAALCFSSFQFETSQRSSPSSQDFASLCEQILEKLCCFSFFQMPNGPKI